MLSYRVTVRALCGLSYLIGIAPLASAQSVPSPVNDARALVEQYCLACHNNRLETGGLSLEDVDYTDIAGHAELWENVVKKLRAGAMPPHPRPRPVPEL